MREIKFRGQKTSTKEFVYGSLIVNTEGACTITRIGANPVSNGQLQYWCFGVIAESVGQFSGLKDKNGVEVYEQDILSVSIKYELPCDNKKDFDIIEEKYVGSVCFDSGAFLFKHYLNKEGLKKHQKAFPDTDTDMEMALYEFIDSDEYGNVIENNIEVIGNLIDNTMI